MQTAGAVGQAQQAERQRVKVRGEVSAFETACRAARRQRQAEEGRREKAAGRRCRAVEGSARAPRQKSRRRNQEFRYGAGRSRDHGIAPGSGRRRSAAANAMPTDSASAMVARANVETPKWFIETARGHRRYSAQVAKKSAMPAARCAYGHFPQAKAGMYSVNGTCRSTVVEFSAHACPLGAAHARAHQL